MYTYNHSMGLPQVFIAPCESKVIDVVSHYKFLATRLFIVSDVEMNIKQLIKGSHGREESLVDTESGTILGSLASPAMGGLQLRSIISVGERIRLVIENHCGVRAEVTGSFTGEIINTESGPLY